MFGWPWWKKEKTGSTELADPPLSRFRPNVIGHPSLTPSGYWADPDQAPRLLVITGAGLSAESGLSTFRDTGGIWQKFDAQQVCNLSVWQNNIPQVHAFHDALRQASFHATPNQAHAALAELNSPEVVIVTQNVDGLLQRAGAKHPLTVHGQLDRLQCVACDSQWQVPWSYQWSQSPVPACPFCEVPGRIKPGVVFFQERAPLYRPLQNLIWGLRAHDAIAVLGTAGTVLPLRSWLAQVPATKWLLNLEASEALPERSFDNIAYGPATQLAPELVQWWRDRARS